MTHKGPMKDSDGTFNDWEPVKGVCQSCGISGNLQLRQWDSNDGAYRDHQFQCSCGYVWWVDGDDG